MNLKEIWEKRQKKRKETDLYKVKENTSKPKFYVLDMFPYPSGAALHVWHPKWYIASDTLARKKMLEWFNVLHPMGFDTFGLWTEQYAIDNKMKPQTVAKQNVEKFIQQLKMFGMSYDRSRSVNTADPEYFKRTQRIFLQLFNHYYDDETHKAEPVKKFELKVESWKLKVPDWLTKEQFINSQRLAFVDYKPINRCPHCMTGLANEDLDDGKCERCGSEVEQKPMKQRVLRITKYAERLLQWLDKLNREESMKDLERNWIGKKEGINIHYPIIWTHEEVVCFTTRPDTNFGATFIVLAPEHPFVTKILNKEIAVDKKTYIDIEKYVFETKQKTELQRIAEWHVKTWAFTWFYADHRLIDGKEIPIWISDFVLGWFGTWAVVGVPGHDIRDFEFAQTFDIPVIRVVIGSNWDTSPITKAEQVQEEEWKMIHSDFLDGMDIHMATQKISEYYIKKWRAEKIISYRMQDRVFSRQRYRGEPFPILRTETEDKPKLTIHFYDQTTWQSIVDGTKTLETRALNPEEPDRYFGDVKVGDILHFENKETWTTISVKIKTTHTRKNLEDLRSTDKKIIEKIYTNKQAFASVKSFEDFQQGRDFKPWYREKIEKNGLVGREFEIVNTQKWWKKVLLIHGFEWRKEGNRFPRITKELTAKWYEVFNETLPNPDSPNYDETMEFLLPYFNKLGENDIVIGHSLWGKFALKLVEQAEQKIGKLILVAPVTTAKKIVNDVSENPEFQDSDIVALSKIIDLKLNFKKIDKNAQEKILFVSQDDPYISVDTQDVVTKQRETIILDKKRHFQNKEDHDILNAVITNPNRQQESAKIIPLDEKDLPLLLPDVENYAPTGTEEWPLANITDRVNVTLPDGTKAKRETNTMPGWAGSSRYRLRYMDPTNDKALVGKDKEKYRGNVDIYIGGAEHVTRHMIYGRFWQKFLFDIGAISHDEPFQEYHYVWLIMGEDGRKMSKRRWNVVNPDDIVSQFWADTLRTYEMFMGPFEQAIAWNTAWISGSKKFLDKVANLSLKVRTNESVKSVKSKVHKVEWQETWWLDGPEDLIDLKTWWPEDLQTIILLNQSIKKITENIDEFKFNTAISQLMILTNHLTDCWTISRKTFETLVILTSPFAPHLAEELWEQLWNEYSIFTKATWPTYDEKLLIADTITIAVQVNGKVRGTISLDLEATEGDAMTAAKADEKIANRITGEPKKVIYVKGKILNIVV